MLLAIIESMKSVDVILEDSAKRIGKQTVEWICTVRVDEKDINLLIRTKWILKRISLSERSSAVRTQATFRDAWEVIEVVVEGNASCNDEIFIHEPAAVRPRSIAGNFCLPLEVWQAIDAAGELDYEVIAKWIPFSNDRGVFLHRFMALGGKIKGLALLEKDDFGYELYSCDGYNVLKMRCSSRDPETGEFPVYFHAVPATCSTIRAAIDWMYFPGFYDVVTGKSDVPYQAS